MPGVFVIFTAVTSKSNMAVILPKHLILLAFTVKYNSNAMFFGLKYIKKNMQNINKKQ